MEKRIQIVFKTTEEIRDWLKDYSKSLGIPMDRILNYLLIKEMESKIVEKTSIKEFGEKLKKYGL